MKSSRCPTPKRSRRPKHQSLSSRPMVKRPHVERYSRRGIRRDHGETHSNAVLHDSDSDRARWPNIKAGGPSGNPTQGDEVVTTLSWGRPSVFPKRPGGGEGSEPDPPPFGRAAPPGKQHAPDPRACRQVCAMLNPLPQYPPTRSWPCVPPHSAFPISVRHKKYASRCLTQQQGCPLVSVGVG